MGEVQAFFDGLDELFVDGDMEAFAASFRYPLPMNVEGAWMTLAAADEFAMLMGAKWQFLASVGAAEHRTEIIEIRGGSGGRIKARAIVTARAPGGPPVWYSESIFFLRRAPSGLQVEMVEVLSLPDAVLRDLVAPQDARMPAGIERIRANGRRDTQENP